MRRILLVVVSFIVICKTYSQGGIQLQSLKEYLRSVKPNGYDSSLSKPRLISNGNLNYLYPLFQLLGEEKKFKSLLPPQQYYEQLSEALAFIGDYQASLQSQGMVYDSMDDNSRNQVYRTVAALKDIQNADAEKYISFIAKDYQVIMLNEAHNKPIHRAFAITLLQDLYKKGFRYLAMEMLNNFSNHELEKVSPFTGYYCTEPVAGEMIRTALDIGFKLVSYEDTAADKHSANERESVQAENIYRIIQQDKSAKIFVYAGYGHIAEKSTDSSFIPMGMAFKKMSGIDPLTIDQTNMSEGSEFTFGKVLYEAFTQKYSLASPCIALMNEQPVNITNNELYDLSVIHPPTIYHDGRANWLVLGGRRQPVYIKAADKSSFLVQAYYQFESFGNKPAQVVPADQTYIPTNKGNYLMYLKRGKYIIVFRNMEYRIIKTQHIEVN